MNRRATPLTAVAGVALLVPFFELHAVGRLDGQLLLGHFVPVGAEDGAARFLLRSKRFHTSFLAPYSFRWHS